MDAKGNINSGPHSAPDGWTCGEIYVTQPPQYCVWLNAPVSSKNTHPITCFHWSPSQTVHQWQVQRHPLLLCHYIISSLTAPSLAGLFGPGCIDGCKRESRKLRSRSQRLAANGFFSWLLLKVNAAGDVFVCSVNIASPGPMMNKWLTIRSWWNLCRASSFPPPSSEPAEEIPGGWTHFPTGEAAWNPGGQSDGLQVSQAFFLSFEFSEWNVSYDVLGSSSFGYWRGMFYSLINKPSIALWWTNYLMETPETYCNYFTIYLTFMRIDNNISHAILMVRNHFALSCIILYVNICAS